MKPEKTIKLKNGYLLEIIHDRDAESPDRWGNTDAFLVYDHRQFTVRRDGFDPRNIFRHLEGYGDYWVFAVDAYIHSGVSLSLMGSENYPDRRWDVSTTGCVLVLKKYWPDEDKAQQVAEGVIITWNTYLAGEVYGYRIMKPFKQYVFTEEELEELYPAADWKIPKTSLLEGKEPQIRYEETDSCWGFFGDDWKTNGISEHIPEELMPEGEETVS